LGQFTGPADAEIDLPESDLSYSEAEPEEADSEISTIAKTEDVRQFQQRMMIVLVGALVLIGIATCGLIYYADTAGLYTLIPSMAPEQITEAAPNPRNGAATVDFRGFAGTRARIEWTRDTTVETCGGGTAGLTVDFGEGDQATINNQVCVGETCVFERDLNVEQVKDAVVTYQCGRDAIITLFR
jgi:hypothetical protein